MGDIVYALTTTTGAAKSRTQSLCCGASRYGGQRHPAGIEKARGHQCPEKRTRAQLDLCCNQAAVQAFFNSEKPDQVYLAAAKVGGIHANNTNEFIYQNLMMQANVIDAAFQSGVKKLLFLGSSCIYPKLAPQPPSLEAALLTGPLEPTNEALCGRQNYRHKTL